jgi:hypothetical protein
MPLIQLNGLYLALSASDNIHFDPLDMLDPLTHWALQSIVRQRPMTIITSWAINAGRSARLARFP